MEGKSKHVLAVASGGGHWTQLRRLEPAFAGHRISYVSTHPGYRSEVGDARFYKVRNASRWDRLGLILLAFHMLWIVIRERPGTVISTGAAPGYFAILFGKLIGARTIWIDSLANVNKMSLSGRRIRRFADLWLTQWEDLAGPDGPEFLGSVL